MRTLHGLLVELRDQDGRHSAEEFGGPLPLVCSDRVISKIVDAPTGVVVASGHSGQHQTCGNVTTAFSLVPPVLSAEHQRTAGDRLQRVLPTSMHQVFTAEAEWALGTMRGAVRGGMVPACRATRSRVATGTALDLPRTDGSGDPVRHRLGDE